MAVPPLRSEPPCQRIVAELDVVGIAGTVTVKVTDWGGSMRRKRSNSADAAKLYQRTVVLARLVPHVDYPEILSTSLS